MVGLWVERPGVESNWHWVMSLSKTHYLSKVPSGGSVPVCLKNIVDLKQQNKQHCRYPCSQKFSMIGGIKKKHESTEIDNTDVAGSILKLTECSFFESILTLFHFINHLKLQKKKRKKKSAKKKKTWHLQPKTQISLPFA